MIRRRAAGGTSAIRALRCEHASHFVRARKRCSVAVCMDLLVLGHVTRDEIGGEVRLGGAASYAALAGARLGFPTTLVTLAPPDDPLLAPLRAQPGLALHCVASPVMTTFALSYQGGRRRLALRQAARALTPGDLPARWRRDGGTGG